MKTLNIRTIFDLKRAVNGAGTTDVLVDAIDDLLLQDDLRDRELRAKVGFSRLPAFQLIPGEPGAITAVERCAALRHLVTVMLDDLHVYRLGELWCHIADKLGNQKPVETLGC